MAKGAGIGRRNERHVVMRYGRRRWIAGSIVVLLTVVGSVFWARPLSFYRGFSELHMVFEGADSKFVSVAGIRVHYYVLGPGEGRAVVLVHGLGGQSEDWQNLAPYLAKAGFRVYLPDLPGFGRSEKPAEFSYSIPAQAAVVTGFLDAAGLKQGDLGGWSMGGWIVQRVAGDHPERVDRLMLFDSAGIYERPAWDTRLFTPVTATEIEQLDVLLMPRPPRVPDFVARDLLRSSGRNAWIIHRALGSMLLGHDTTDDLLPSLGMPVLIVWGSEDHITPLSQGEKMHRLVPQSQLEVIQGCGHLAPGQCAGAIAPRVVGFLKE
jgi:pimeloyl-ACP methyl ester carboxylesterase